MSDESVEARLRAVAEKYDDGNGEADALVRDALRRIEYRKRHGFKVCSRCNEKKPVADFGPDGSKRDGLASRCRACDAERQRDYRRR